MYTKLFAKILQSSVWLEDNGTRIVWITLLATMDETGFAAFSSVRNLAHTARVSLKAAQAAIARLEAPDPDSGDPDHDGRRIARVPGGWLVLNGPKYRALATADHVRARTRERVARWRARAPRSRGGDTSEPAGPLADDRRLVASTAGDHAESPGIATDQRSAGRDHQEEARRTGSAINGVWAETPAGSTTSRHHANSGHAQVTPRDAPSVTVTPGNAASVTARHGNAASASASVSVSVPDPSVPDRDRSDPIDQDRSPHATSPRARRGRRAPGPPSALFEEFWAVWPHKVAKQEALIAWQQAGFDEHLDGTILVRQRLLPAIRAQTVAYGWGQPDGQFAPHPATWLRGRRWEDEVPGNGAGRRGGRRLMGGRGATGPAPPDKLAAYAALHLKATEAADDESES